FPEASVKRAPADDLLPQVDDPAVERVDRRVLLGDLPGEGAGFAGELAQLHPVGGKRADHGDGEGKRGERAPRHGPREVEPNDLGAIAPNDQETELITARHTRARPRELRSWWLRDFPHRLDRPVSGTLFRL